jgi:hypothetical protein
MNDTLEQLKIIRDEYQRKVDALNEAIDLFSVAHPDVFCVQGDNVEFIKPEQQFNPVIKNEPLDFSSIPDWNGNKKGGIRND